MILLICVSSVVLFLILSSDCRSTSVAEPIESIEMVKISPSIKWMCLSALIIIVLSPGNLLAGKRPVTVDISGDKAEATYVKGDVFQLQNDLPAGDSLTKGDMLFQGNRFSTKEAARIELKLPDDSFLRFDEKTAFELSSVGFDKQKQQRSIGVRMILGKTWANVSKLVGESGRFEIAAKTAVAGVRGTVYRVNVLEDDTVIVKVYWGEILLKGKSASATAQTVPQLGKPSRVLGPQPIAGPRPVSMGEWTYIVKSMQQITVRPDGTTTKPFRFSPEEDLNDWVRWNKERDETLGRKQE